MLTTYDQLRELINLADNEQRALTALLAAIVYRAGTVRVYGDDIQKAARGEIDLSAEVIDQTTADYSAKIVEPEVTH